jgi:hypothetical protein
VACKALSSVKQNKIDCGGKRPKEEYTVCTNYWSNTSEFTYVHTSIGLDLEIVSSIGIHLRAQAQRTNKTKSMEINTNPLHVQSVVDIQVDCTTRGEESASGKCDFTFSSFFYFEKISKLSMLCSSPKHIWFWWPGMQLGFLTGRVSRSDR